MSPLPDPIRPGQRALKTDDWNFLINEVRRLTTQTVTKVLNESVAAFVPPRERTVVITKTPSDSNGFIIVRPVRYATTPPKGCEGSGPTKACFYEFAGDDLEVYPDFGFKPSDYSDSVLQGDLDDLAPFLRMYFEAGTWRLQKPVASTAIDRAIVRDIPGATAPFIIIERVRPVADPEQVTITIQPTGVEEQVQTEPGTFGMHYELFKHVGVFTPNVATIWLVFWRGLWWADQHFRFGVDRAPFDIRSSDCVRSQT